MVKILFSSRKKASQVDTIERSVYINSPLSRERERESNKRKFRKSRKEDSFLQRVNGYNLHVLLGHEMAAGETSKTEESWLVKGSSALGWSQGVEEVARTNRNSPRWI